jgi:hypothetical protein
MEYDALLIKVSQYWGTWHCWCKYYSVMEYDVLLIKVSQYWGMWRSIDVNITVLRNMALYIRYRNTEECDVLLVMTLSRNMMLCYLRYHVIEKCEAQLMKISQYDALLIEVSQCWRMWRPVDEVILVLWNMTLCWRGHTLAEYNALLIKVLQDWGMWRSVDEDITVLQNVTLCLRHHNNEECGALLIKLSQYWGMWRPLV